MAGVWRNAQFCKPTEWLLKQIWQDQLCLLNSGIRNQKNLIGLNHSFFMPKMAHGSGHCAAH